MTHKPVPIDYSPRESIGLRAKRRLRRAMPVLVAGLCLALIILLMPSHWIAYTRARYGLGELSAEQIRSLRDGITTGQLKSLLHERPGLALDLVEMRRFRRADMEAVAEAARDLGAAGSGPLAAEKFRWWLSLELPPNQRDGTQHAMARSALKAMFESAPERDKRDIYRSFLRIEGLDFKGSPAISKLMNADHDVDMLFAEEYARVKNEN